MTEHTTHPDAQWFPKAELGLFLHWGISSVHGNIELSWGMMKNKMKFGPESVTPAEYFDLAKRFDPIDYDPEKWIKAAAEAGFKYTVLTTRHHDSFALWPSRYGDFNTKNYLGGKDLVADYVNACRKYGMKVGLYYSPPDFRTAGDYLEYDGWQSGGNVGKPIPKVITDYVRAIVMGQITELFTRYGKIDLIWYDGNLKNIMKDVMSREETYKYQPGIVIGRGIGTDFLSSECELPTEEKYNNELKGNWWECCHEWNYGWGYKKSDETSYKSVEEVSGWFKAVNAMHGNLLLNVAPSEKGALPQLAYDRFGEFGEWLKKYREEKKQ